MSAVIFASIISSVPKSELCAFSPDNEAVISATGFLENSIDETVQSIAFFNVPGTPIAYSGVQINIPSASRSCLRKSVTCSGIFSLSKSGLKCGKSDNLSKIFMVKVSEVMSAIAFIKLRFEEAFLVLPEIANIFILSVISCLLVVVARMLAANGLLLGDGGAFEKR